MSTFTQAQKVLELLCEKFPKTFFMLEVRRRPLKLGITKELEVILGDAVELKSLKLAMRYYAGNIGYLKSQKAGAPRIDLDGNPAGAVSEDEAKGTKARIYKHQKPKAAKPVVQPKALPPPKSKLDGLAALREAARKRREAADAGGGA